MPIESEKFRDIYVSETGRRLAAMNHALLKLEKKPGALDLVNKLFAEMHALKSMASTMNYQKSVCLCHAVEDVLDAIRNKKIKSMDCVDILFEAVDILESNLKEISQSGKELAAMDEMVEKLTNVVRGKKPPSPLGDRVVIPSPLTGEGQGEGEVANFAPPPSNSLPQGEGGLPSREGKVDDDFEKIRSIEVKVGRLDALMNLSEGLLTTKLRLDRTAIELQNPELTAISESFDRLITDLQYNVMQSRTVPLGFIFNRFPRMVRDLAKMEKKDVELQMEGGDIELDRSVVDELGQSLVHLLRNAVDHGIEIPSVREKAGKSAKGAIKISASQSRAAAMIKVSDDGDGIPPEGLKTVFEGKSTAKQVTTVSGRGLGLQIVKNKIESLGGGIRVESILGRGTTFILELPLTLAVIRTLFVDVAERTYGIPLVNVSRLVTVAREDIKGMISSEAIVLEGEDIPILRLGKLFGRPFHTLDKQPVAVVKVEDDRLGLFVDAFASTQETVIKPLSRLVKESRYFAGSTITGSGEAVLILDVGSLVASKKGG